MTGERYNKLKAQVSKGSYLEIEEVDSTLQVLKRDLKAPIYGREYRPRITSWLRTMRAVPFPTARADVSKQ